MLVARPHYHVILLRGISGVPDVLAQAPVCLRAKMFYVRFGDPCVASGLGKDGKDVRNAGLARAGTAQSVSIVRSHVGFRVYLAQGMRSENLENCHHLRVPADTVS